jgi:hypothetical protein
MPVLWAQPAPGHSLSNPEAPLDPSTTALLRQGHCGPEDPVTVSSAPYETPYARSS